MNETDEYILDSIKIWVWSGFYDRDETGLMLEDILEDEADEEFLRAAIETEFEKKMAAEKTWAAQTDCDRLDAVFATLNSNHIIALQNAGYTMSDGLDDVFEIFGEKKGSDARGYCFYHGQDLERAVDGSGLTLAFGSFDDDPKKKMEIGRLVKQTFENAGFEVEWNGDAEKRLNVPEIDWKRRTGV